MPTSAQLLTAINTKISALVASPEVDWKDGDVSVKAGQKLEQLLKAREVLLKAPDADLALMTFDNAINDFGVDLAEYT